MTRQDLDHLGPAEDQVSPEDQECLSGEGGPVSNMEVRLGIRSP